MLRVEYGVQSIYHLFTGYLFTYGSVIYSSMGENNSSVYIKCISMLESIS